jgi:hypothetical protein
MTDIPSWIVALATRILPTRRREWGVAMAAELAQLPEGWGRLRFALGCLYAASSSSLATTGVAVRATLLVAIIGCIALTAYVFSQYPTAGSDIDGFRMFRFVAALAVYSVIVVAPPRILTESATAVRTGGMAGVSMFVATSTAYWAVNALPSDYLEAVFAAVLLTSFLVAFVICAATTAAAERSFRAGVVTAVWASAVCALLGFVFDLVMTLTVNLGAHSRLMLGGKFAADPAAFLVEHMGEHLASAMGTVAVLPLVAIVLGAIGAAIGSRWVRGRTPSRAAATAR